MSRKIQRFELPDGYLCNRPQARSYLVNHILPVADRRTPILVDLGTAKTIAGSYMHELIKGLMAYYGEDHDFRFVSHRFDRFQMARAFQEKEKKVWTSMRS